LTSSRSHFVFQIEMYAVRGDEESRGRLILVDLAGSEPKEAARNDKQAAGGAYIRTSLTSLKTRPDKFFKRIASFRGSKPKNGIDILLSGISLLQSSRFCPYLRRRNMISLFFA
jgi:hypothetical protein